MKIESLNIGGKKYAVIPFESLQKLQNDSEELADISAYDHATKSTEEFFPFEISERSAKGENRIMLFREHRGISQQQLADTVGITRNYISLLETGKKQGSVPVLKKIAKTLSVDVDAII